jgi:hypothetical protein
MGHALGQAGGTDYSAGCGHVLVESVVGVCQAVARGDRRVNSLGSGESAESTMVPQIQDLGSFAGFRRASAEAFATASVRPGTSTTCPGTSTT